MRRSHLASLLALGLLAPLAYAPNAEAAPINPGKSVNLPSPPSAPKPPPPTYVAPPPEGFHWSALPRVDKWASAWRPQTWPEQDWPKVQTYDPEYVNPSSWPIEVQGCRSAVDWP